MRTAEEYREYRLNNPELYKEIYRKYRENNREKRNAYNREYRKNNRLGHNCRRLSSYYLDTGKISKTPCIVCGSIESEMHHQDYHKPKEVIWLCRIHHQYLHAHKEAISETVKELEGKC
jgi:hypothetical protein